MSREIKFRAWDTSSNKWVLGLKITLDGRLKDVDFDDEGRYEFEPSLEQYIIEQYTGLKDKNGKMIREGDIVKTKAGDILQVNSLTHSGWFATGIKSHNEIQLWLLTIDDCIEIIGNIHENPELLEDEK